MLFLKNFLKWVIISLEKGLGLLKLWQSPFQISVKTQKNLNIY